MWTWQCRVLHVMSTRGNVSRHQRIPKSKPTPEIHAKVLRSSATQATCAQALVSWHVISFPQFSLRCCQRVERLQSSIGGGTAVARGTNRAHNGSEDCQDCNDHIDSAGSNCTPLHRLTPSRFAHRALWEKSTNQTRKTWP